MQYVSMNGSYYDIYKQILHIIPGTNPFISPQEMWWTKEKAEKFSQRIVSPTTLIGFSRGATWALWIAAQNENVKKVIAHSPSYIKLTHNRKTPYSLSLFRTIGDLTPTFTDTWQIYVDHLVNFDLTNRNIRIVTLPFEPFQSKTWVEFAMKHLKHQFNNVLPHLRAELSL